MKLYVVDAEGPFRPATDAEICEAYLGADADEMAMINADSAQQLIADAAAKDQATIAELRAERDHARRDLAELVAALTKCEIVDCESISTLECPGHDYAQYCCDAHGEPIELPDTAWAAVVRRLKA